MANLNRLKKIAAALALGVAGVVSVAAQADTLRVGMSGGYFPFTYVEQDELKGFEVDVMNAVGEITGDEIEFVTASFSGLAGMLESGRIDTIANQITITDERKAKYAFTAPYVYDGAQVVVREGNDTINGVEDLSGKSVAVNLGSNYEQLLREQPNADEIDIRTYESNVEQVISERGLPLALAGQPFTTIENALPFRDDEEGRALRDRVDAALEELRDNGTLGEISQKWFDTDITQP